MDTAGPLLSVVVTSRNDNHGGTLLRRMQTFTNCFIGQCKRHNLSAELIIVEWNPPADKPPLAEALKWPADLGPCSVRVIQVPNELHARMRHSASLPLFQMIAKNVGIRRARGQFVLCTNIDILLSDELVQYLASGKLESGRMYRIDRHDVATEVPVDGTVDEQLAFCRNNYLRVNARAGTIRLTPDGRVCPEHRDVFGEGEFLLDFDWNPMDRWDPAGKPARWLGKQSTLTLRAPDGPKRALRLTVVSGPSIKFVPFDLEVRDESGTVVARGRVESQPHSIDVTLPLQPGERGRFRFCVPIPVATDSDGWQRACLLTSCAWTPPGVSYSSPQFDGLNVADVPEPAAREIVPDDSILLSRGWVQLHYWQGQPIHWATRKATIVLPPRSGAAQPLRLMLESGPSVGSKPFMLEVLDERNAVVTTVRVETGVPVTLELPDSAEQATFYRLRAVGTVKPDFDGIERVFRLHSCSRGRGTEVAVQAADGPLAVPPLWYRAARRVARVGKRVARRLYRPHPTPETATNTPVDNAPAQATEAKGAEAPTKVVEKPAVEKAPAKPPAVPALLHTNACGDFTLMSLRDWMALRGNPEWEIYSLHIDSVMCHAAHNAGVVETMLEAPMQVFHIEHNAGSGWTPEGESLLVDRMSKFGIPVLEWSQVYRWCAEMQELSCTMIFNGPDWGLACETLPETTLSGRTRAVAA